MARVLQGRRLALLVADRICPRRCHPFLWAPPSAAPPAPPSAARASAWSRSRAASLVGHGGGMEGHTAGPPVARCSGNPQMMPNKINCTAVQPTSAKLFVVQRAVKPCFRASRTLEHAVGRENSGKLSSTQAPRPLSLSLARSTRRRSRTTRRQPWTVRACLRVWHVCVRTLHSLNSRR